MDIESLGKQRSNDPTFCRIAKETRETSLQLCEQALVAQEVAQELRRQVRLIQQIIKNDKQLRGY